jgi:cytochrome P450
MAFMDYLASYPGVSSLAIFLFIVLGYTIYTLFLHPLASVPGHPLAKISSLWLYYHTYVGDEATAIHDLHKKYNSALLRVAPNHVDISDPDAISPIYEKGGGFPKSPCYANFDIDAHKTIFSTTDNTYRTPRAKAVVPLFSTASIRGNSALLYHSIDGMVTRLQSDAATGRPVNILNLTRSLAVDIVSTHLFDTNYNGTGEKTNRLSVSAFVDAFVAVGRFFYCPNWVFGWLEWCADKLFQDLNTYSSMEVVDKFVEDLVSRTSPGDTNYPGRLMGLGLQKSEVVSQCKDLIFAGTDSTGMNLASIFRYLAVHQDR